MFDWHVTNFLQDQSDAKYQVWQPAVQIQIHFDQTMRK